MSSNIQELFGTMWIELLRDDRQNYLKTATLNLVVEALVPVHGGQFTMLQGQNYIVLELMFIRIVGVFGRWHEAGIGGSQRDWSAYLISFLSSDCS